MFLKNFMREFEGCNAGCPTFDCRAFVVPNKTEAANQVLWRERDSTKNAISSAAYCKYSAVQLHKKSSNQKQEMLFQAGVNFNDYPAFFKRGVFVQRKKCIRKFTSDEIDKLPKQHEARSNPDLMIERQEIVAVEMPPFSKVTNRVEVIFDGADPITTSVSQ